MAAQQKKVCSDCEYTTIEQAVKQAEDHDTILIKKGIYPEHDLLITRPLTIIGENDAIIDGEDKGEILRIQADHVTIDGLTFINVGTSYTKDFAAVRVVKSKDFMIRNLKMKKLFFGVYLERAQHGKVINNTIFGDAKEEFNSGNGIHLWHCKNVEVQNNKVQHVRDGIYLEFSDSINIHNNYSAHNVRYGLHFMFSNYDNYEANTFEDNGAGVAVMFSKFIKMRRNTFKNNWGTASYGLLLKEINDAEISHNIFKENTIGINVEGSNRINYKNNEFINNGWAVKIRGANYENAFVNNDFLYNSFDISYNSKLNNNLFDHNFWSNYTGYDLDKNGIGDV
ncbi:MAG: nitrous oxide reductase family maturation protein NosD, partial [Gillisia sp.]